MTDIPWIVSLDDHVVEPADVWTSRLPAKYRDVGPHIVMAPAGTPILDGGTYSVNSSWSPSSQVGMLGGVLPLLTSSVSFRFTAVNGSVTVDDVYLDPMKSA